MKTKLYDFIWWNIGLKLWRMSAQRHNKKEVQRRLDWMKLDSKENI